MDSPKYICLVVLVIIIQAYCKTLKGISQSLLTALLLMLFIVLWSILIDGIK